MTDIQSPFPGTFYCRPSPKDEPFKSTGSSVKIGETMGLIEVMKTFFEVKAEITGTFDSYVIEDGSPVTAGQVLAKLKV